MRSIPRNIISSLYMLVTLTAVTLSSFSAWAINLQETRTVENDGEVITTSASASNIAVKTLENRKPLSTEIIFKLKDKNKVFDGVESKSLKPTRNLTKLKEHFSKYKMRKFKALKGNNRKYQRRIYRTSVTNQSELKQTLAMLQQDPDVEWAEENHFYELFRTIPNDSAFSYQYRYFYAQSNILNVWDTQTGSENVVIAIIDSGVDYDHPDLDENIWKNTNEIPDDGIDNDGNGYIDDVIGWDFVSASASEVASDDDAGPPDNDPMDVQGHGTHVAGIAAAEGNNAEGIAGVSWHSKIMPLRAGYKTPSGGGLLSNADIVEALYYACDNGADIVSMSFGSTYPSKAMENAIEYCRDQGVTQIAAAGNNGSTSRYYPAGFESVIAVSASDYYATKRADFSTHGVWVDILAPGSSIYSTTVNSSYGYKSGTSMAAPFVAGMAALIKSNDLSADAESIRKTLLQMAVPQSSPADNQWGAGYARLLSPLDTQPLTPHLRLSAIKFDDVDSNQNLTFDSGDLFNIIPSVRNFSDSLYENLRIELTSSSTYLEIIDSVVEIDSIQPSRIVTSESDTFQIRITGTPEYNHPANYSINIYQEETLLASEDYQLYLNSPLKTAVDHAYSNVQLLNQRFYEYPDQRVSMVCNSQLEIIGAGNKIYHRLRDSSGNWGPIEQVPTPDSGAGFSRYAQEAVVDSNGGLHLKYLQSEGVLDTEVYYAYFEEGYDWKSEKVTENGNLNVQDFRSSKASIALDQNEQPVIVWLDGLEAQIKMVKKEGDAWTTPQVIADLGPLYSNASDGISLKLASFDNGNLMAVWEVTQNNAERSKLLEYATYSEGAWSAPLSLPTSGITNIVSLVQTPDDIVHLAYYHDGTNFLMSYENNTWSEPTIIMDRTYPFRVVVDEVGKLKLFGYSNANGDIVAYSYNDSVWQYDHLVHERTYNLFFNDIIVTQGGTLLYGPNQYNDQRAYIAQTFSSNENQLLTAEKVEVSDSGEFTTSHQISAVYSYPGDTSDIEGFRSSIGSVPGADDLQSWTNLSSQSSYSFDFTDWLNLSANQQYFVNVQALGTNGHWSGVSSSDGIRFVKQIPNSPPYILISEPSNGSVFNEDDGPITLLGQASDQEDGDLSQQITWYSDIDGEITSPAILSLGQHLITASVTDSGGLTSSKSVSITIEPHINVAPTLTIFSPIDGASYDQLDGPISLSATATDPEDGDLSSQVQWSSDIDGAIQSPANLSAGTHTITARVADSDLAQSQASVTITVTFANQSPVLEILSPSDGTEFTNEEIIAFSALATDAEDGDVSAAIMWHSDRQGPLGDGASINVSNMVVGQHIIIASVKDSELASVFKSVTINIVEPSDPLLLDAGGIFAETPVGEDPADWVDTAAGNSMNPSDDFKMYDVDDETAFGTKASYSNIHSHYTGAALNGFGNSYELSGRLKIANANGGIGITFFSDYTNTDSYYRIRRYAKNQTFHLSAHGTSQFGNIDSGVNPAANEWYQFRIQVEDTGAQTEIRGRFWQQGDIEPTDWQIDAYDNSASRLTSGTIGLWSMAKGGKYWNDIKVTVLGDGTPPANTAPTVNISTPSSGITTTEGQILLFEATANDVEDGDLSSAISWQSDLDGFLGTGASLITSNLAVGVHSITATASDSKKATATDTITVNVETAPINTPPTIVIIDPSGPTSISEGDNIAFSATANDTEDGDISAAVSWQSDLDGFLGIGASININSLTVGVHTISASINDSEAASAMDTITVTVDPIIVNTPPTIAIIEPNGPTTISKGDNIALAATANDAEEGDLSAAISWQSDLDGFLGTGSSINTTSLSIGIHTISANVNDRDEAPATDTVIVTVVEVAVNSPPIINIIEPNAPTIVTQGDAITFSAMANDAEDGDLSAAINWQSNLDGFLGTGGSIRINSLSIGSHNISAFVADLDGEPGSDSVSVTVNMPGGSGDDPIYNANSIFDQTAEGADPADWTDTDAGNSMNPVDLHKVEALDGNKTLYTSSTANNIHSHYTGNALSQFGSAYQYTGRLRITHANAGIGITFFSDYNVSDRYYRLRRYANKPSFHLSAHGTTQSGDTDSSIVPVVDTWYQFKVQVKDTGSTTEIKARLWIDGEAEPSEWQIDAYDDASSRLTTGTIGVWSMKGGKKYWDDLVVRTIPVETP